MALPKGQINDMFLKAVCDSVTSASDCGTIPLCFTFTRFDLRCAAYTYTITRQLRGRPQDEYKIQVIIPGASRGTRQRLDTPDGRYPLLVGYSPEFRVFALWDATLYADFAYSRNVQVREMTLVRALSVRVSEQERFLRQGGRRVLEVILAARAEHLAEALSLRLSGGRP